MGGESAALFASPKKCSNMNYHVFLGFQWLCFLCRTWFQLRSSVPSRFFVYFSSRFHGSLHAPSFLVMGPRSLGCLTPANQSPPGCWNIFQRGSLRSRKPLPDLGEGSIPKLENVKFLASLLVNLPSPNVFRNKAVLLMKVLLTIRFP